MAFGNEYIDDYETCNKTYASLFIARGPDQPESVTKRLGLQPTTMRVLGQAGAWRKGEWRGQTTGTVSRFNLWGLSTQHVLESRDSLRHIDYLLELLEGKDDTIASLAREGWKTGISIFWDSKWGHGGPQITPSTMARLAQLGLTLGYDVYFSEPHREPE